MAKRHADDAPQIEVGDAATGTVIVFQVVGDHYGALFLEGVLDNCTAHLEIVVTPDTNLVQVMKLAASDTLAVDEETALATFIDEIVAPVVIDDRAVIARHTAGEQQQIVFRIPANSEDPLL